VFLRHVFVFGTCMPSIYIYDTDHLIIAQAISSVFTAGRIG